MPHYKYKCDNYLMSDRGVSVSTFYIIGDENRIKACNRANTYSIYDVVILNGREQID